MRILRLIIFSALALIAGQAEASHVLGGNFTWQCLGAGQYQVTFTMYRDCYGQTAPLPVETVFMVPDASCGIDPTSVGFNLVSTTEVTELCPTELINSSCNGGILPGVQRIVYTETVTLDPSCAWTLYWVSGDWNYANNINFMTFPDAYIHCEINPAAGCISSPQLTSQPVPYECRNQGVITNPLTWSNTGGLTLNYTLGTTLTLSDESDPFSPPITVGGFSQLQGLSIDAAGVVSFNSAGLFVGNYTVVAEVEIYQGANYVGTIYQNYAMTIRDCASTPTNFNPDGVATIEAPAILVNPTTVHVCAGDSVCFTVSAANTNPFRTVNLTATWPGALNAGNPVFDESSNLNPRTGEFCMNTTNAMVGGPYLVHFEATDDQCVLPGFDEIDVAVTIYPQLEVNPTSTLVCAGEDLTITATGGTTYTWTALSGSPTGLAGTGGTQTLTNMTQDASVQVELVGSLPQCNSTAVVDVDVSLSSVTAIATDETCLQNDGAVNLTVVGGSGNYTYNWNSGAFNTEDISALPDGQYCVVVTETAIPNCSETVCANVANALVPNGSIAIQGGVSTLCQGQSATLVFTGTGDNTQPYTLTVTGSGASVPASISHNGTFTVTPPVGTTTYTLTTVSYQNFPQCSSSPNSQVTFTVRPLVTGQFTSPGPICTGNDLPLTVDFTPDGTYNVTYTANPADPASAPNPPANPWTDAQTITFNPSATTTYTITNVEYTTAPACPNPQNNSISVTVNPLPTANLTGGTAICEGDCTNLNIALTGTAPWTINYTLNGAAQAPLNAPASPYVWNVCPAADAAYCITSVTDANGCTQTYANECETVTVTPSPTASISGTAAVCSGQSASLSVAFTGAAPYTFQYAIGGAVQVPAITTSSNPYTLTTTQAGAYTLTSIALANGCTGTVSGNASVTVNPLPTAALAGGASICAGACTDLTLTLTGTGPWNVVYSVNGGPNQNLAPIAASPFTWNVCPTTDATYCIVSVTDANGCVQNYTNTVCQTVTVNPLPTATIAGNGTVCAGSAYNFAVSFTGASPWTYTMTTPSGDQTVGPPAVTSPNNFSATAAGNYFVTTVTDANGCTNSADSPTVTLTVNPQPTATINAPGVVCAGGTFAFGVTFTGGAPFTFNVDGPGANDQNNLTSATASGTFNATVAGDYVISSVTDNIGCSSAAASAIQTLTINPLPTAALAGGASICEGACTDLTLTLTGTGPWNVVYSVNGGPDQNLAPIAASPFTWNVCPTTDATYCIVSVTDANGCVQNYTNTVCQTVTVNPLPTAAIAGNGTVCAGSAYNFAVSFTGASPWTYTMTTPSGDQTVGPPAVTSPNNFSATAAGNYFVTTVTDANGCTNSADSPTVTLTVNPQPTATIDAPGVVCAGGTFTFDVSFTGGAPFTFNVDGPGANDQNNLTSATASGTFNATVAGDYVISSVTDNIGCSSAAASAIQTLTINPLPTAALAGGASICAGACTDLTLTLTGTGPWNVVYSVNGGPNQNLAPIAASPFTWNVCPTTDATYCIVSVTDANGCVQNYTNTVCQTVTVNPLPTAAIAGNGTVCAGSAYNFAVSFTGASPWTYTMTTPSGDQTVGPPAVTSPNNFSATAAGNYFVTTVTDANGCTNSADSPTVTLTVNPQPTATIDAPGVVCAGGTFTFDVSFTGGAPFTFNVDGPGANDQNNLTSATASGTFNATVAGDYVISSVSDNIGCSSAAASAIQTLTINPLPTAALAGGASICAGACTDLTLTLTGTGPWNVVYSVNGGPDQNLAPIAASPFTWNVCPTTDATYCIVSVTDANGCVQNYTNTVCQTVTVNPLPTATIAGNGTVCAGSAYNFAVSFTGASPWTYTMTTPSGDQTVGPPAVTSPNNFSATAAGNYFVTTVTDANGCTNSADSPTVTLTVNPQPTATIDAPGVVCAGGTFTFDVSFTGGAPFTFNVDGPGANDQNNLTSATASGTFNATVAGDYVISSVSDNIGCSSAAASAIQTLTINPLPTAALAGGASICAGACTDLTLTLTGTGPWNVVYSVNGGPNQNLAPIAASPFTWNVCPTTDATYCIVSVTDANGCVQNYTNTVCQTVTVNPLPTAAIAGNGTVCAGSAYNFAVSFTGASPWTYTMTTPSGDQTIGPPAVTSPDNFSATACRKLLRDHRDRCQRLHQQRRFTHRHPHRQPAPFGHHQRQRCDLRRTDLHVPGNIYGSRAIYL
jgi:large repetitive protein